MNLQASFEQLKGVIGAEMARWQVPGVAVGVWFEGQAFTAGLGSTSVEHPLPVTADTLFQIGSTTKTVTGTAVMRLVEMGKLDLDVSLTTYLPDLRLSDPDVTRHVTLRHLFTHTGGWSGDYFSDTGLGDDAVARFVAEMEQLEQLTPLGELWSYNNAGFSLAGRVIEVVTGLPYETAVHNLVLAPLGMDHSFFFAHQAITHRVAVGHQIIKGQGKPQVARPWAIPRSSHPAGGIVSTVNDQLRYARFHLGDGTTEDGTRLLTETAVRAMQSPQLHAYLDTQFGITWFLNEINGVGIVRHGGATHGQTSAFLLVPSRGFAITVLTNSDDGTHVYSAAVKWALDHYLGLCETEPEPIVRSQAELTAYCNTYDALGESVTFYQENGSLMMQITPKGGFPDRNSPTPPAPPPTRVVFYASDTFMALDDPHKETRGEFIRAADGSIVWLRVLGRLHRCVPTLER